MNFSVTVVLTATVGEPPSGVIDIVNDTDVALTSPSLSDTYNAGNPIDTTQSSTLVSVIVLVIGVDLMTSVFTEVTVVTLSTPLKPL